MNRDQKAQAIEEIAAQIAGAEAIFAVDYRGISVPQAAELRGKLREADASFRVVKNRLTKIAAEKVGKERLGELLEGPTALTFVRGDTAMAAKAISTFGKDHEVLSFKGGFMDGLSLDEDRFKSIARLPARNVLDGQLAGVVASPLTGLVRGLGSMIQGLALQLGQIAEQGLVSGEAPADSSAGPVAEGSSSSSQAAGDDLPSTPPADQTGEEAPQEKPEAAEAPAEEPEAEQGKADPPAPGREAEEAGGNGEDESPSEEASQSDSSPMSEGGESPETDKEQKEE
jgi:large subunit ribosomal protein L10